jgi:hypothetical protein
MAVANSWSPTPSLIDPHALNPPPLYSDSSRLSPASTDIVGGVADGAAKVHDEKPRCWDHGCNGREFSSPSNFRRHVRERSGEVSKPMCHLCGAVFARTSGRDRHIAKKSCNKAYRDAGDGPRSVGSEGSHKQSFVPNDALCLQRQINVWGNNSRGVSSDSGTRGSLWLGQDVPQQGNMAWDRTGHSRDGRARTDHSNLGGR